MLISSTINQVSQSGTVIISTDKDGPSALQVEFENAIQAWDLEQVLSVLKKGQVDPHTFIIPNDELAEKLMVLDAVQHVLFEEGDMQSSDEFVDASSSPAWILISLFTKGTNQEGLRIEILDKFREMIDHDIEERFDRVFDQVVKLNDFEATDEMKDFFNAVYCDHIEQWKADYNFNFEDSEVQPPECPCYLEGE